MNPGTVPDRSTPAWPVAVGIELVARLVRGLAVALAGFVLLGVVASPSQAHCDALDGPVVKDGMAALEQRDVTPVLKWVDAGQEDALRAVFSRALAVRGKGTEAKALADQFFFEALVRLHRAGEGEPFTGLKPAGSIDPGLAAADEALRTGSVDSLSKSLAEEVRAGVRGRHAAVVERARHANDSVEQGREYVRAYVDYVHFVESVHRLVAHGAQHRHQPDATK